MSQKQKTKDPLCMAVWVGAIFFMVFGMAAQGACAQTNAPASQIKFSPGEQQWLNTHKTVRIGGPRKFPPFHYYDGQGNLKGMNEPFPSALTVKK